MQYLISIPQYRFVEEKKNIIRHIKLSEMLIRFPIAQSTPDY